ncbi:uncharacterized protein LOC143612366 [Bidens hawaiensis]|uniref:uncharacterized protein LOC143612366 n=1 Tax=Bidens hawaiensis TaxID=980011 RepID=UPI0040496A2D
MDFLKQMKTYQESQNKSVNQRLELQEKANAARDKQVSQLAEEVASLKRNPSKLPSDTLKNSSHQSSSSSSGKNAHVSQVSTLRSGKIYNNGETPPPFVEGVVEDLGEDGKSDDEVEIEPKTKSNQINKNKIETKTKTGTPTAKETSSTSKIVPFPRALVNPETSSTLRKRGPQQEEIALLYLGAGVSILPGSLYDQYDFGPLRKADTTVVLAELTLKLPRGIVTDVIVMIEDFYYSVDFLVLDYVTVDPKRQPNVILGRPFLATTNALINCRTGVVDMDFGNKNLRLNVFSNVSNPLVSDECFATEVIDGLNPHESEDYAIEECAICCRKTVEHILQLQEEEKVLELYAASIGKPPWSQQVERLPDTIDSQLRPSLESPPAVELKELPKHLKYVFLGEGETLPAIIAANLEDEQEKALVEVLKEHKEAIGWTIADLRGISPSIVMHKIITDPEAIPAHDAQRRLNPNMREVVKKEVLKWLDAGIIFPISDSTWVSPTQTVPKKAGIQITRNERGEEIATRPVTEWRICVDYRKLNAATSKDHFPLPFIDQIIEKLAAPVLLSPDWSLPFEIMCDASDYAVGAVLGQWVDKKPVAIYYASKTLSDAKINYTTKGKELLAVVYALDKFDLTFGGARYNSGVLAEEEEVTFSLAGKTLCMGRSGFVQSWSGSSNESVHTGEGDAELWRKPPYCHSISPLNEWASGAYKTLIGTTPYRLVYGKGCHLPVELAHRALWAVKNVNLDYECPGKQRKLNICELEELRDEAYEYASAYKDKMKRVHDAKLRRRTFEEGQRVWLYNSRLKLFPGKLKSKWTGPYQVKRVGKFGEVEIEDFDDHMRQVVNGHRLKPYLEDADLNEEIH